MNITINNLTVKAGSSMILCDVSHEFENGKLHCVIGPNGSGKTTLVKEIVKSFSRKESIAFVPQETFGNFVLQVRDVIALGRYDSTRFLYGESQQDKDRIEDAAKRILQEAKAVEKAGAFAVVLECIPDKLAKIITEEINIPTIGIGAGSDCDGQILVYQDMLGMFGGFKPKFVKRFANVGEEMTKAFKGYIEETKAKTFPAKEHCFKIDDSVIEKLY